MRVLVACEFSATVRDAFTRQGHDAWSCDMLASEKPGQHIRGDVIPILSDGWDIIIAHPPCTNLAVSGARWFKEKRAEQESALDFVRVIMAAPCDRIALENPVSIISSRVHHFIPCPKARPDNPALDVRTRRNQSDMPLA